MSALAVDMQLDFWSPSGPEPVRGPARIAVLRSSTVGGERTLEELVLGAWEELAAHRAVCCLVCGGDMGPLVSVDAEPTGGRCADCGTQLC